MIKYEDFLGETLDKIKIEQDTIIKIKDFKIHKVNDKPAIYKIYNDTEEIAIAELFNGELVCFSKQTHENIFEYDFKENKNKIKEADEIEYLNLLITSIEAANKI